ncbi:MAG: voltage-gated chloride channel protein, partial [Oscillospiraceae bacterium]|nr:voltage-gated chloride channel protein [Oscillospiraceae bacterium]
MKDAMKKCLYHYRDLILYTLLAVPVGAVVGGIDALFGRVLLSITDFRSSHPMQLIPFLALGGAFVAFYYMKYGNGAEKGMGLIFAAGHGTADRIPLRLIPFIMIGTWITHLF